MCTSSGLDLRAHCGDWKTSNHSWRRSGCVGPRSVSNFSATASSNCAISPSSSARGRKPARRRRSAAADIGISWLPNDLWSRGKCGLKVLQYMAAGLPVVANPVGVQGDMVRHGETGFLANTDEEWLEAIGRLARDPVLRQCMGRAGRRRVEAHFSVGTGFASWLSLLGRLAQHGDVAKAEGGWN